LPGNYADSHARYLEADIVGRCIVNIYLPNGNPPTSDNFA
jgi:exonuclease III